MCLRMLTWNFHGSFIQIDAACVDCTILDCSGRPLCFCLFQMSLLRALSVAASNGCYGSRATFALRVQTTTVASEPQKGTNTINRDSRFTLDSSSFVRSFATRKTKKRRQRERNAQLRKNARKQEAKRKHRMNNLHKAAKMKRILSACDYWFSADNLRNDVFLTNEIRNYQGYVRLTTLASFPKLEGWANEESLICQALQAAPKRYTLIYNRELVEKVALNTKRRERREKQEGKEEQKRHKREAKERKRRIKELKKRMAEMESKHFLEYYKEDLREWLECDLEEEAKEKVEQGKKLAVEWSHFTASKKVNSLFFQAMELIQELIYPSSIIREQRLQEIEATTENDIDWELSDEYHTRLEEENEEYSEVVEELRDLEWQRDMEAQSTYWNNRFDREISKICGKYDKTKPPDDRTIIKKLGIKDDSTITKEEVLPNPILDDGSKTMMYALVKHKRVTLDYLDKLNATKEHTEDDWEGDYAVEYGHHGFFNADYDYIDHGTSVEKSDKPKVKVNNNLQKYTTSRPIMVISTPKKLKSFCRQLTQCLEESSTKAVGMDVEYCTLECDIRQTLPAMLQLASPNTTGPVGLIWLDKFANNGKNMIGCSNNKGLFDILEDSSILKVGVDVDKHAEHLAHWWGISEDENNFKFSGMTDLQVDHSGDLMKKSLHEMCANVLQLNLPKGKEKGAKRKKNQRKKGRRLKTSHWRRNDLTKEMKLYAANHASCAIDIWLKVQEREKGNEIYNLTTETEEDKERKQQA